MYDNAHVVSSCQFVILCVLPSQLGQVIEDIKGHIKETCIIYCLVAAIPLKRLKQIIGFSQLIRPNYSWPEDNEHCDWDHTLDILEVFQHADMVDLTCPLSPRKSGGIRYSQK